MKAKHLNVSTYQSDLTKLQEAIKGNKVSDLFLSYIDLYNGEGVSSFEDVISLLLITAISLNEQNLVDYLLKLTNQNSILTTTDKTGYSAISSMLYSGNEKIQKSISDYLSKIPDTSSKVEFDEKDFRNVVTILEFPKFVDLDIDTCINLYLRPLYSESSLDNISELLGLDPVFG